MTEIQRLYQEALQLEPSIRRALAESLFLSLDGSPVPFAELPQDVRIEVARRDRQLDDSPAASRTWEDVRQELFAPSDGRPPQG